MSNAAANTITPKLNPETAEVGMAVTQTLHTDRNVYHIIEVQRNGKTLVLQQAKTTLLNGPDSGEPDALRFSPGGFVGHTSGKQRWDVEPDPEGRVIHATWRRTMRRQTGKWDPETLESEYEVGGYKEKGWSTRSPGGTVRLGAYPHHDFNF